MNTLAKVVISLVLTVFSISIHAQSEFGVRSAINIATWNTNNIEFEKTVKNVVGFSICGFAEIKVVDKFSIQPELHIIQKGYQGIEEDSINIKLRLDYFELPLHIKFNFVNENFNSFILAGPYVGLLFGGQRKEWVRESEVFTRNVSFIDRNPRYERLDFGLSFGGGVKIKDRITIDVRYAIGMHGGLDRFNNTYNPKNRGFQIGLGYVFGSKSI